MTRHRTLLLAALFVLALFVAWQFLREPLAVDRCLDSGGSYDYETGACDYEVNRPAKRP